MTNASRHAVELVGEELVQAELAEATTLCEAPLELLEELPEVTKAPPPELLLEELPEVTETPPELLLEELLEEAVAPWWVGCPVTLALTADATVSEAVAVLAVEPASLEPPQAARAAVRARTASPWPRIRQLLSLFMSLASLSGENPGKRSGEVRTEKARSGC